MLPYSVIKQVAKPAPPKPLVWHSKHYLEVHGVPIIQPKLKVIVEGKNQPVRNTALNLQEQIQTKKDISNSHHLVDMNYHPVKGFRVGQQSPPISKNRTPVQSELVPNRRSSGFQNNRNNVEKAFEEYQEQQKIRQYEIRQNDDEETVPKQQNNTYTDHIVNNFGNQVKYQTRPEQIKKIQWPQVEIERQQEICQQDRCKKMRRQLGILKQDKNWSYEVILTRRQQQFMRTRQPEWVRPPSLIHPSTDELLESIHPVIEEQVHLKVIEWERKHIDSHIAASRLTKSNRRHRIFESKLNHNEVQSQYMLASEKSRDKDFQNIRIQESQVHSYGQNFNHENKIQYNDDEDLQIRQESGFGNKNDSGRHIYENHIPEEQRQQSRYQ